MSHIRITSSARAKARMIPSTDFFETRFQSTLLVVKHLAWLCLLLTWFASTPAQGQMVVINEIMYHPPTTNLLEEWFEIYNPGTNAVDLSGWQVTKGIQFTFP